MHDVHQRQHGATIAYEDNEGAVKLANNSMASKMTEHVYVKHHYIRELVDARTVAVAYVGTADMMAGGLTKALPEPKHTMIFIPKHTMIFMRCMRAAAPSED
jgi:hypothetical protein